jgi:hypothetical protein
VFFTSSEQLADCMLPEKKQEFEEKYHEVFDDPANPVAQPGRLKVEGIFRQG